MNRVRSIEIGERLEGIVETLSLGETVDVTQNGTVLGRIVPVDDDSVPADNTDLITFLENFGRTHYRGELSVRQMRDEGRP